MSGRGARRATGWAAWLSCHDRPAPPVCIARLAARAAAGDVPASPAISFARQASVCAS